MASNFDLMHYQPRAILSRTLSIDTIQATGKSNFVGTLRNQKVISFFPMHSAMQEGEVGAFWTSVQSSVIGYMERLQLATACPLETHCSENFGKMVELLTVMLKAGSTGKINCEPAIEEYFAKVLQESTRQHFKEIYSHMKALLLKGRQSVPELATFYMNYPALALIQMKKGQLSTISNQLNATLVLSRYVPVLAMISKLLRQSTKRFVGIANCLGGV